jgi:tetratricopeptide (TPR) repeat protein
MVFQLNLDTRIRVRRWALVFGAGIFCASYGQARPPARMEQAPSQTQGPAQPQQQQSKPSLVSPSSTQQAQQGPSQANPGTAPKVDLKEDAAYKLFYDLSPLQTEEQIKVGEAFLADYPSSRYREVVYSRLVQAYLAKQDTAKVKDDGARALALNPNDVDVLTTLGWVIPHSYNPGDPNAAAQLQLAENYLKHALQILATIAKPETMTEEDFTRTRDARLSQAHSGLGLIYFRRGKYADAVLELQQSTKLVKDPDPIDFFILGISLQQSRRFDEAAAAYDQCARVPNSFQPRCQAGAEQTRKVAGGQAGSAKP